MNQSNNRNKRLFFILLFGFGCVAIVAAISTGDFSQSNRVSFAPLFQLFGKAPQSLSRSVTKMLPIDSVDEGELGKNLRSFYTTSGAANPEDQKSLEYLNSIVKRLQRFKKKPFDYEVRILQSECPNAMALPGGVIVVTSGLLKTMKSESELVSVIAHEMGHIEMSHCFDSVKYEILTKKLTHSSLGAIADFSRSLLIRHSFSKTQEDEADNYGFQLLVNSEYDPTAMTKAFKNLKDASGRQYEGSVNPIRDYFMSHPPLEQRISKFSSEAQAWWSGKTTERRYIGTENLKEKTDLSVKDFGETEWITKFSN
jgi:predicted Zn-dependent protease